jgi:hypothetical protein
MDEQPTPFTQMIGCCVNLGKKGIVIVGCIEVRDREHPLPPGQLPTLDCRGVDRRTLLDFFKGGQAQHRVDLFLRNRITFSVKHAISSWHPRKIEGADNVIRQRE